MANGGGPWDIIVDFLSSQAGGNLVNLFFASLAEDDRQDFLRAVEQSNVAGVNILRDTLGISQPTFQVREAVTNPEARAEIQAKIDAGDVPEAWVGQFVDRVPGEAAPGSAIDIAGAAAEEARTLGRDLFDPDKAAGRFQEEFGPTVAGFEALPGQVATANEAVQNLFGGLRTEFGAGAADLNRRFGESLETARGLVSSLGEAERLDINRRFTEAGGDIERGLFERGVGGGTISSSLATGVERERSTALLGLGERLATQQLDVEETFGLGGLSARERLLGTDINIGALQGGAMQFGNQLFANTAMGSLANLGNIAGGQVGAFDQAAINQINNLFASAGIDINTLLAGSQQGLNFFGPNTIPFTQPPLPAQILPSGSNF